VAGTADKPLTHRHGWGLYEIAESVVIGWFDATSLNGCTPVFDFLHTGGELVAASSGMNGFSAMVPVSSLRVGTVETSAEGVGRVVAVDIRKLRFEGTSAIGLD
jgi:hypothetical protein